MKGLITLALGLALLMAGCTKDDTLLNSVNFNDLKIGQKSIFQQYESTCGNSGANFKYTQNRIALEVIEEDNQFYLKETLLEGSPLLQNAPTTSVQYEINSATDYILLPDREESYLFYFYGNDTIWLAPQHDVELSQTGCKMEFDNNLFIGNEIGRIEEFSLGKVKVEDKTVVSCVPMIWGVDAYLAYDENQLYMSHVVFSSMNDEVSGWFLEQ